jgi:hypothetical protein
MGRKGLVQEKFLLSGGYVGIIALEGDGMEPKFNA